MAGGTVDHAPEARKHEGCHRGGGREGADYRQ